MKSIYDDQRIVLTLDAGGTNFVFSAMREGQEIVEPIRLPSYADRLDKCLENIIDGFSQVKKQFSGSPVAISFAFPGPADYPNGIIGDLVNLPAFRGGVALGPMLEEKFDIPVYINNDGDLFTYGESIAGLLPYVNDLLEKAGNPKRFKNLFGITLGTGFGGGIVHHGELYLGDNAAGGEINRMRDKFWTTASVEESVSIRGVRRFYAEFADISFDDSPSPKDICRIGLGKEDGNQDAAVKAYAKFGEAIGDALADAITLIDGLAVIGGGVSGAHKLFMPAVVKAMNDPLDGPNGTKTTRMEVAAFNLHDETELDVFLKGEAKEIAVPLSDKKMMYDPMQRVGVGISKLDTSIAMGIGAYAFALNELDKK